MKNEKPHSTIKILLSEDDLDDCFFFQKALEKLAIEFKLSTVRDGEELMKYLTENLGDLPDIIFLDLSMPRKTGIECLVEINENELLNNLPIVILSTSYPKDNSYEQGLKKMLISMGAKEFVRKPSDIEQLKELIRVSLSKYVSS